MERKIKNNISFLKLAVAIYIVFASITIFYIYYIEFLKGVDLLELKLLFLALIITGFLVNLLFYRALKDEINTLANRIVFIINSMIAKKEITFDLNKETIISKVEGKFKLLYERFEAINNESLIEKEAVKGLIADISHQVKTPMANIKLYNETMISRELTDRQRNNCLNLMAEQVQKVDWLTNGLFKLSRLEVGAINIKKEKNSLKESLVSIINQSYLKASDRDIEIAVELEGDIKIYYDKKWTEEAIYNVVDNAIKYGKENSTIEINIDNGDIFTSISIKNEGVGIRKENLNNVFKRFFREDLSKNKEGVGIGLFLARDIIERQGGFIKLDSEYGEYADFKIYLLNTK